MSELAEIAVSVAKALGLKRDSKLPLSQENGTWDPGIYRDGAHTLDAFGADLFSPYWQVRCRDWLLEQKYHVDFDPLDKIGLSHDLYTDRGFLWSLDCPASEFCARAIHELTK